MDDELDVPTFATLFGCYRPIEQYLRARGREDASDAAAAILTRIDAFLLHQIAALWPREPVVVDHVADATGGSSAAFWAAHPSIRHALVPSPTDRAARRQAGWRETFRDVIEPTGAGPHDFTLADALVSDAPEHPEVARWINGPWPVLYVTCAATGGAGAPDEQATGWAGMLQRLLPPVPGGAVLVLGLGNVGACAALDQFVRLCGAGSEHRLTMARELSPFFAASGLGIISAAADPAPHAVLRRIAATFAGNFEFLSLARALVEHAQHVPDPVPPAPSTAGAGQARGQTPGGYQNLINRVREVVKSAVPPGSVVIVVSKGDDELLRLGRTRGRHFPQAANGTYAGHYPKDGAAAVEHLEALRVKGGQFLLLPATSLWWLEHYEEMRRHLETRYAVVVCRPDVCILFDLRTARRAGREPVRKAPAGSPTRPKPLTPAGRGARRAASATHIGRKQG